VPLLLKPAQLTQGHGAPDVQARAGGIDPVLHAQLLTRAQALLYVLAHDHVDHAAREQLIDLMPIAYGRRRLPGQGTSWHASLKHLTLRMIAMYKRDGGRRP
jgi:hypothetical protein